jgi:hypothetical protein
LLQRQFPGFQEGLGFGSPDTVIQFSLRCSQLYELQLRPSGLLLPTDENERLARNFGHAAGFDGVWTASRAKTVEE